MIRRLETRAFRNLVAGSWEPVEGRNLLLGSNGAGKTSVLEAIYVGATTRSFRTPRLSDTVALDEEALFLRLDLRTGHRLELGWRPGTRRRAVDGQEVKVTEYLRHLPVVVWTAESGEILTGEPKLGRRLMDRGIVGTRPGDLGILRRYRKILRQKRELLSRGGGLGLASWNDLLAEAAAAVVDRRAEYMERLREALEWAREKTDLEGAAPEILYRPSPPEARHGVDKLREALASAATREKERGIPLLGPHRDRLRFRWRGRPLHRIASAGERKGIGLLLVAAEGRVLSRAGREPVLLLDDLDSELDAGRLAAVWPAFVPARQVFASSSRPDIWSTLEPAVRWRVEEGRIRREDS